MTKLQNIIFFSLLSLTLTHCSKNSANNNVGPQYTMVWGKEGPDVFGTYTNVTVQGIPIRYIDLSVQELDTVNYQYITVEDKYVTDNNWTVLTNGDYAAAINSGSIKDVYNEVIGVPRLVRVYNVTNRQDLARLRVRAFKRI
jgi:hypothetical protein